MRQTESPAASLLQQCPGLWGLQCIQPTVAHPAWLQLAISFPINSIACWLQAAVELCWLSCVSSELNGEEVTRSGGVDILGALLARCCSVMPQDVAPNQASAVIATHCLRTLAGMAIFANAKSELVSR